MFDLTHRTEADGSVVARAEIPCTLHLTSSDFEGGYYGKHAIQFALSTLDTASYMLIDALEEVGTNGRYTPLVLSNDLIPETKKELGALPADFAKFMDTYADGYVDDDGDKWLYGIHGGGYGDANYRRRGVGYLEIQSEFHRDLTAALVACKTWREDITRQVQGHVNECLGSTDQLWNVEISDPVPDENNRWYDAGFNCTLWYETRVQA